MTEVLDESLSWEQRRELRRKKRQELLAEADRIVKTTDSAPAPGSLSRLARDRMEIEDDDEFEKERQRRRREREERRKKERDEFEKTLREEEEQRAERDRRREERRRLREEAEKAEEPVESYTSTTVIRKTVETYDDSSNHQETSEVVMETTAVVTEDYPVENGRESAESSSSSESDAEVTNGLAEDEPQAITTTTKTITITTTKTNTQYNDNDEDDDANEVQQKLTELKLKRQQSGSKRTEEDGVSADDRKARLKQIEEKMRLREEKEREQKEREREEAAKRDAEYQEQLRIERDEREKRRAEAEAKRQAYRKQMTQSEDHDQASPLSPKLLTSSLGSKVEQLNKHISDSPKTTKTAPVANVGSLDSRLEKYTKQASKQEVKKASGTPGRVAQDVSDRRNRWERGDVISSGEKVAAKKEPIASAGSISSRKNLWESGKVGSSPSGKSTRKVGEVTGADFSSRKNQWLKVTQQDNVTKKSESTVGIKTGVMSRLNQWEKGEVGGASPAERGKMKTDLPAASGVVDRRAKWENRSTETPKSASKRPVKLTTDISGKKNVFEAKSAADEKEKSYGEEKEGRKRIDSDRYSSSDDEDASDSYDQA